MDVEDETNDRDVLNDKHDAMDGTVSLLPRHFRSPRVSVLMRDWTARYPPGLTLLSGHVVNGAMRLVLPRSSSVTCQSLVRPLA